MSECRAAFLSDRAVVRVTGEAARNFLQGLITNHVDKAVPGSAIHAGLLTPQGKILVDFFVLPAGGGYLLETAKDKVAELIQRLTIYKLRSQVAFAEEPSYKIAASWGSAPQLPDGAVAFADPRLPELGFRILLPSNADVDDLGCTLATEDDFDRRLGDGARKRRRVAKRLASSAVAGDRLPGARNGSQPSRREGGLRAPLERVGRTGRRLGPLGHHRQGDGAGHQDGRADSGGQDRAVHGRPPEAVMGVAVSGKPKEKILVPEATAKNCWPSMA